MDFSENYSFMIQEVQSYHWTSVSCTIHPVINNVCIDQEKIVSLYCVISDDLNYDVCMVYKIQKTLIQFLKMSNLNNIVSWYRHFISIWYPKYRFNYLLKKYCFGFINLPMTIFHSEFYIICNGIIVFSFPQ